MKNLIIKWLGLEGLMDLRITQLQPGTVDAVIYDLSRGGNSQTIAFTVAFFEISCCPKQTLPSSYTFLKGA